MKNEQAKVIKSLMLSAAFALLHTPAEAKAATRIPECESADTRLDSRESRPQRIDKNVYKVMRDGATKLIAAHRSHSSHRSHRSSRAGSYSRSSRPAKVHRAVPQQLYSQKAEVPRKLGERALVQGMRGADVDELVAYLVRFYYLHEEDAAAASGECEYNAAVVEAVRHFQRDAGYVADGKLTGAMVDKLKQWDPARTTITLGFRPLAVAAKMAGHDVDTLVELLIAAGCAPDGEKLIKQDGHYVFTEDVCTALKVFQATHGERPTGELDAATLKKLHIGRK
ncbi:MAG: peptidoglycan-binding protein [Muribaculaceae bacterium]|nr:peptidoglycan-binding protein [Muribaculaceae bacterium]